MADFRFDNNTADDMVPCAWPLPRDSSTWTAVDLLHSSAGVLAGAPHLYYRGADNAHLSDELLRVAMLPNLRRRLADTEQQTVDEARAAGHTWAEIGEQLGVTKQAASLRYGTAK
jgi:hypothetical protein